tara:strand:- start:85 stop:495 length:411 start_codon:yes stop_codon:yes gene_type:complete
MSQASDYLENKLLDHTLRNTAFSSPSAVYVGLFLNTSGNAVTNLEAGTLTDEVSGNGYARIQATFAAASGGSITTSGNVTFAAANGGDFGTITHIAILDQLTGGNVLFYGALTTSKTIQDGDTFQITTGNLTVTLA